jgi:hypothetical protein
MDRERNYSIDPNVHLVAGMVSKLRLICTII